jgi:hypothetical protein
VPPGTYTLVFATAANQTEAVAISVVLTTS